ncbi:MAG: flagellar filament capping protein FliD [Treponema sp.]
MSDINIPGVAAGKYDKLIETLMQRERAPRDSAAENLQEYKRRYELWQSINRFSNDVREKTRTLYSFNNPFAEKRIESSNEQAITATASRGAREQKVKIAVNQKAQADSFLSKDLQKDYQVPTGKYTFAIGEKKITIDWQGGHYKKFIDLVNRKARNNLRISEIKTTDSSHSLLFEAQSEGSSNKLQFEDDALTFALDNEIIKKNDGDGYEILTQNISIAPQATEQLSFPHMVLSTQQSTLEYTAQLQSTNTNTNQADSQSAVEQPAEAPPESQAPETQDTPAQSDTQAPEVTEPEPQPVQEESSKQEKTAEPASDEEPPKNTQTHPMLSLIAPQGSLIPLPPIEDINDAQIFTVPLNKKGNSVGLSIRNTSGRTLHIDSIKIRTPDLQAEYIPVNAVSRAQDAVVTFEGITVIRGKNDIDDLVPDVTLHIADTTEKKEVISVTPDSSAAKNAIIEFVATYNRLLAEINIATSKQPEIIEEISYFTDEERKQAEENLGLLFSDTTLATLKNNLRQVVSNVYRKNDETTIRSLSHIGISTKTDTNSTIYAAQLRGYLEIDEKQLDEALKNNIEDVRALFGYDTNNDRIADDGVAVQLYAQIDPYIQRGGIFATRTNGLKTQMQTVEARIERYDKQLEKKEQELKQKYGVMDGSLKNLERQSRIIDDFSKQNKTKD